MYNHSGLPSLPLRLSALQVIGLTKPVEGDWARLRAIQYSEIGKLSTTKFAGHCIGALLVMALFVGEVPNKLLALWAVGLGLAVANVTRIERSLIDLPRRLMTRDEYTKQAVAVAAMAVLWSTPLLAFVPAGNAAQHYATWSIVAMVIAGSASVMVQVPIATVLYVAICGSAAILSFSVRGDYPFAIVSGAFCVVIVSSAISSARTFLTARIAEAGVLEKDEVVSLLLREYEENEADWLWQVDTHRRITSPSPRFAYALGKEPSEVEGESMIKLISGSKWEDGELPSSLHELAERLKKRESFSNLVVQAEIEGQRRWWELSGTPILGENGKFKGFRGVGSDITERRESDEKIAYLARYDTLTGLPNRLMLTEGLADALRYSAQWKTRCAFLMIDLDRFKAVNDSLGHLVGDRLLAHVSQRLKQVMGENEQVGRLGGDEFAVVIRDASSSGYVEDVAARIIEILSQPYIVDNHTLYIGASVGSAIGPRDGTSVETLMRNADLALYRAKDSGGGEHCKFMPALHSDAEERRTLEASLRNAIGNDELTLNYQPVVNAKTEQVVSFEALLRWNSVEHGFVSPGKFIPLAEDTRLIVPIGDWVLRAACKEASTWPEDIKVAVNVSGEQLLDPHFSSNVVRALADSGLAAHRLEVEVTESVFLRDGRTARQTLEEIMALGCTIALDDFGTGYSSLGYLRNMRFSTIKVDRSFVQGATQDSPESLAIIRAVVAMAQSLEMSTTAEGVEDAKQAELIRDMGCTKIQGFYFGRPMPATEARSLVVKRRTAA